MTISIEALERAKAVCERSRHSTRGRGIESAVEALNPWAKRWSGPLRRRGWHPAQAIALYGLGPLHALRHCSDRSGAEPLSSFVCLSIVTFSFLETFYLPSDCQIYIAGRTRCSMEQLVQGCIAEDHCIKEAEDDEDVGVEAVGDGSAPDYFI